LPRSERFLVCVNNLEDPAGRVWLVRARGKWLTARAVQIEVPVTTVFRGPKARQPKAYLQGVGRVRRRRDGTLSIAAS